MSYSIVKHRRGTTQEWLDIDLIPEDGELVIEECQNNICKCKIGNGKDSFTKLPYLSADIETRLVNLIESAKTSFDSRLLTLDTSFKYNLAKAIADLDAELAPQFEDITTLVRESEQHLIVELDSIKNTLVELEDKATTADTDLKQELENVINKVKEQLVYTHNLDIASLDQRISVLAESIDVSLNFDSNKLKAEILDSTAQADAVLAADISELNDKLTTLSDSFTTALKTEIAEVTKEIETDFYTLNEDYTKRLDKLKEELDDLSTQLNNQNDQEQLDIEVLGDKIADVSTNLKLLEEALNKSITDNIVSVKNDTKNYVNKAVFALDKDIKEIVKDYRTALSELKDSLLVEHAAALEKAAGLEAEDKHLKTLIDDIDRQLANLGISYKNLNEADLAINNTIFKLNTDVTEEFKAIKNALTTVDLQHLDRHVNLVQTVNNLDISQQLLHSDALTLLHSYITALYNELANCVSNDFYITHRLITLDADLKNHVATAAEEILSEASTELANVKTELTTAINAITGELRQNNSVTEHAISELNNKLTDEIAAAKLENETSIYKAKNDILKTVSDNHEQSSEMLTSTLNDFRALIASNTEILRNYTDETVSPLINLIKNLKADTEQEFEKVNKALDELETNAIADNAFLVKSISDLERDIEINKNLIDSTSKTFESKIEDVYDETTKLAEDIATQTNRINTIALLNNGSLTPGDSELVDIRNGYNGEKYSLAGEAVRAIGKELRELDDSLKAFKNKESVNGLYYDYLGTTGLMLPYMLYLTSGGQVLENTGVQIISGGGSGTGGGSSSSTLTINYEIPSTSFWAVTPKDTAELRFKFTGTDSSGDAIAQASATWKVNGTTVEHGTVTAGSNVFDATKYLVPEDTITVLLLVKDDTGSVATKSWQIQHVKLYAESSFDAKATYPANQELLFDYTPYGAVDKTAIFKLDGEVIDSFPIKADISGTSLKYRLDPLTHGSHLLEFYLTASINNGDVSSDSIYKDILIYDPKSTLPIIGVECPSVKIKQYSTTNIVYTVYDPATETPTVTIKVDNKVVSTATVKANAEYNNTPTSTYSFTGTEVGTHTVQIICKNTVKTITVEVEDLGFEIAPVTEGLAFDFNPVGFSNDAVETRLWKYNDINLTVSDNFDWTNGGYVIDENGDPCFCVKAGSEAFIDYKLFADDAKKYGKEFKLVFKTKNVANTTAQFLTCLDKNVGLEMAVHEARIYGQNGILDIAYSEEDVIEFEFNISKNTETVPMVMGYEDGVPSRPMVYNDSYNFTQESPKIISIGSPDCDVYIYRFKVYNTSLTNTDILNNFIADARSADEMISRYTRNQIYNENHKLTPETLAEKCPWLRIYKLSAPKFTNNKSEKIKNTTIQQIYKNGDPVLDNWTCYKAQHSGQGTSSNNYGAAGRNLDFIMNKDDAYFELGDGSTADSITLTRESVPVAYLNAKVNIASSNNLTNAILANRYNEFNPYRRPFVSRDGINTDYIKDTMEFHNCVIFIKETDPDLTTHREFADTDWHFYAIGNIGDSKKTDNTRATDPNDKYECCVEIMDVGLPLSDFPADTMINAMSSSTDEKTGELVYKWAKDENLDLLYELVDGKYVKTTDTTVNLSKTYYIDILENDDFSEDYTYGWRYITDDEDEDVVSTCKQAWIDFYRFATTSSDADFKAKLSDYFVVDSALYYYLFTTRYCMVDNRAKNTFWHYSKTSDGTRKWDLCWDYDNDTSLGLNNYGKQVYRYGLEDTDTDESGMEVFRESDSTFFCRIRELFSNELKAMYKDLESKNAWHAESFLNKCDEWQNEFPEELWRLDIERKYIRTYTTSFINGNPDIQFLTNMCNGRMKYHRRQWERNQEIYMASKYQTIRASSDKYHVNMRVNSFNDTSNMAIKPNYQLTLTPYSYVYLNVWYGDVSRTPISLRAEPNKAYTLPCPSSLEADIINIGSAEALMDLGDLSACYPQTVSIGNASRIKKLILGNDTEEYDNAAFSDLTTGANPLLEEINLENVSGMSKSLDLRSLTNLKRFYAYGTQLSSVLFAEGGKIQDVELPPVTEIVLKSLKYLNNSGLKLTNYDNVNKLVVEDCTAIDQLELLNKCTNVAKVRLSNIHFGTMTYDDFKNKVFHLKGVSATNADTEYAVLEGTITFDTLTGTQFNTIKERFPLLRVSYNTLNSDVTFKDVDAATTLKIVECTSVNSGTTTCVDPVYYGDPENTPPDKIAKPVLSPSENGEFEYAFIGWSDEANIIVSIEDDIPLTDEGRRHYREDYLKDIAGDRVLYPVFESIRRKYLVYFYNKTNSGKELVEVIEVPYGSKAICTKESTIKKLDTTSPDLFSFTGWLPNPTRVTGEMECFAQFAVDDGEWHVLDLLDISNCPVYGGGTKDGYTLVDDNIYITEYNNGLNVAVKIPETLTIGEDTYKVVKLAGFSGDTVLELVSLPNSLKELSTDCFSRCTCLLEINLPNSIEALASGALYSCNKLLKISIPESVKRIEDSALAACSSVEEITVHPDNERYYMKNDCLIDRVEKKLVQGLPTGTIPVPEDGAEPEVTSLAAYCFSGLNIKSFEVPNTIGSIVNGSPTGTIAKNAFSNCKELESVILPDTIKLLDATSFAWDNKLKTVKLPNMLETIGTYVFYQTALTDIVLPATVKYVYENAFGSISSLKKVTFTAMPNEINHKAFTGAGPAEFHLPWTRKAHEEAFQGTYNIGAITYSKDICFGANVGSTFHFVDGEVYRKTVFQTTSFDEMEKEA